jgi:hypothetical protein
MSFAFFGTFGRISCCTVLVRDGAEPRTNVRLQLVKTQVSLPLIYLGGTTSLATERKIAFAFKKCVTFDLIRSLCTTVAENLVTNCVK